MRDWHIPPVLSGLQLGMLETLRQLCGFSHARFRQCIVEVLKNPFEPTVSTDWIERIFELFKTRLDYGDDQVKESTIATIGAVGKSSSFSDAPFAAKFLGHSLFLLFSELNNNNVLLRGLSFSQVSITTLPLFGASEL